MLSTLFRNPTGNAASTRVPSRAPMLGGLAAAVMALGLLAQPANATPVGPSVSIGISSDVTPVHYRHGRRAHPHYGHVRRHHPHHNRRKGTRTSIGVQFDFGPRYRYRPGTVIRSDPYYGYRTAPRVLRNYGARHHAWCDGRYRSYRSSDGTFQPYRGPRRRCNSPYDGI